MFGLVIFVEVNIIDEMMKRLAENNEVVVACVLLAFVPLHVLPDAGSEREQNVDAEYELRVE